MKALVFLCLLLLSPSVSWATPLPVQTGEHATFTRVVITAPEDAGWQIGRDLTGYVVRVETENGFDLAGFFDPIPRDRIVAVTQDSARGELRLAVSCLCNASAYLLERRFLVIDIRDGPATRMSSFELALPALGNMSPAPKDPVATQENFVVARAPILPLVTSRLRDSNPTTANPAGPASQMPPIENAAVANEVAPELETPEETLQAMTQMLTESLGRGLTEGLLRGELTEGGSPQMADRLSDGALALPGVTTQSGIDPFAVSGMTSDLQTQTGQACLPDEFFDVGAWGTNAPPHEQIKVARGKLVDQAGQFDAGALLDLARLYVFLGFGQEAQQTLLADMENSRERLFLRLIAQTIDQQPVQDDLLTEQVSCTGKVALWALLAETERPFDAQVNDNAVISAFKALSPFVQDAITPRLAEALLEVGARDTALQVLNGASGENTDQVDLALAQASLADALGEGALASETIVDAVRNGTRITPNAMVEFFRTGIEDKLPFSDADFLLADALRFENADTGADLDLADAQFAAYLSVGRIADARSLQRTRLAVLNPGGAINDRATLFQASAERLPDADFLEFIWDEDLQEDSLEAQLAVADRLLDLGFSERTLDILAAANGERAKELREAARVAAERSQDTIAEASEDPLLSSSVSLGTADVASASNRSASGDGASVARLLQSISVEGPSLRNSRELVQGSIQSRAAIRDLLEQTPAPDDP